MGQNNSPDDGPDEDWAELCPSNVCTKWSLLVLVVIQQTLPVCVPLLGVFPSPRCCLCPAS